MQTFMRKFSFLALAGCLLTACIAAQSTFAPTPVVFDVAAIKAAPDMATVMATHQMPSNIGTHIDGAHVNIGFASLQDLIVYAYSVKPYQISGPDFINVERFDIQATLPAGATKDQVPEMVQALLADRFKLAVHHEPRDLSVYALVVGKDGSQLTPAPPESFPPPPGKDAVTMDTPKGQVSVTSSRDAAGNAAVTVAGADGGTLHITTKDGAMALVADRMKISDLTDFLTSMVDRPVVDMTGLTGAYQVSIAISADDLKAIARATMAKMGVQMPGDAAQGAAVTDPSGNSIFASVQKLGLKLDSRKAPIDLVVVDHLEKTPTAN